MAASRRGKGSSALIRLLWIIGIAIPPFATGIALQLIFGYYLNILPVATQISGALPTRITGMIWVDSLLSLNGQAFVSSSAHLILPEIALSLTGIGQIVQLTYAGVLDETGEEYYTALIAFGAEIQIAQLQVRPEIRSRSGFDRPGAALRFSDRVCIFGGGRIHLGWAFAVRSHGDADQGFQRDSRDRPDRWSILHRTQFSCRHCSGIRGP